MFDNRQEFDDIPQAVGYVTTTPTVRERKLGAGRASDDNVYMLRKLIKAESSNIGRLRLMPIILEVRFIRWPPTFVGRDDFDSRQLEAKRPAPYP
jgi:hypothetical protein